MKNNEVQKTTRLSVIEKSLFFRAFTPLVYLALLAFCIYSWAGYFSFLGQFNQAVKLLEAEGFAWEYVWWAVELDSQTRTFWYFSLFSTIAVCLVGLIVHIWAAGAVSNFAGNRGLDKRQYFWVAISIGPLIPWIIARGSKKTSGH